MITLQLHSGKDAGGDGLVASQVSHAGFQDCTEQRPTERGRGNYPSLPFQGSRAPGALSVLFCSRGKDNLSSARLASLPPVPSLPTLHSVARLGSSRALLPSDDTAAARPVPSSTFPPLTSDPVSVDPQLDINSKWPESHPGDPSGPRAGARGPAQKVGSKSTKPRGRSGQRGHAGGGGHRASRRRRRREEGEGCRHLAHPPPGPQED